MRFLYRPPLSLLVASLAISSSHASSPSQYRLLHRLYSPAIPGSEETLFSPRAYIQLDASSDYGSSVKAKLVPLAESDSPEVTIAAADLNAFVRSAFDNNILEDSGALYQVAIERVNSDSVGVVEGGTVLDISSVRACHLPLAKSSHLVLHVSSSPSPSTPFSIDHYLAPTPPSGSCPPRKVLREHLQSSAITLPIILNLVNTSVEIRTPVVPSLPALRTPPPLTQEGAPVQPLPEKSFVQKYWMYIAVGLVALMLAPGAPEESSGEGGNGGGR